LTFIDFYQDMPDIWQKTEVSNGITDLLVMARDDKKRIENIRLKQKSANANEAAVESPG